MARVQLALNVDDLDAAVGFYSALFRAEPAKRRPGYANFAIASPPLKLVLLESPGRGGTLNHLGVEVESTEQVDDEVARLREAGLVPAEEKNAACCYAVQDKAWVTAPSGEPWEIYTVLADSPVFGAEAVGAEAVGAEAVGAEGVARGCCAATQAAAEPADRALAVTGNHTACC